MEAIKSYQAFSKKVIKNLIPLSCLFELTYNCNLSCVHCYIVKNKKKEMTKKEIFNAFEQLKDAGCLYITFSGGEPLCRKDFFEIAHYAHKLHFALRLFTNGTLINEEVADKIRALRPHSVEISLYGFKNTHEIITQAEGSFDKTIKAIKLLKGRGVRVFVKAPLMKQNVSSIWQLKKFVKNELKVFWRGVGGGLFISPCDGGNRKPLNYRLTDKQLEKYIREESVELKSLGKEFKPKMVKSNAGLCGAGKSTLNITPYGDVNPCVQIRFKNNSIKNSSLVDIWKNHAGFNHLRSLRVKDLSECKNCELLSYCFLCPGASLLEEGSLLYKLPEACRQAKIRKEVYNETNAI